MPPSSAARDASPVRRETAKGEEVSLEIAGWQELQDRIAAERGRIVVVNIWSTTCGVCREHFPEFVDFHGNYRKRNVECLSLNCDYDGVPGKPPEYYRERVLTFLHRQKATCENLLSSDPLTDLIDREKVTYPQVLVYGRDGSLARRFDSDQSDAGSEGFTFTDVAQTVDELLKEEVPIGERGSGGSERETGEE